ncbi:hypothetical protein KY290_013460 [Solanum tuberosum]|uniref:Uncharacterized protein n=1 Tax=Solanum tuberosum TaxID=4113 RepID=A0ABQ7VLQ9_SOLTU|nr:hypothetical protein KY290_013460 [Solanum tuberosum]
MQLRRKARIRGSLTRNSMRASSSTSGGVLVDNKVLEWWQGSLGCSEQGQALGTLWAWCDSDDDNDGS